MFDLRPNDYNTLNSEIKILKTLWCFQRKPLMIDYIDGGLCKANRQAVFPLNPQLGNGESSGDEGEGRQEMKWNCHFVKGQMPSPSRAPPFSYTGRRLNKRLINSISIPKNVKVFFVTRWLPLCCEFK